MLKIELICIHNTRHYCLEPTDTTDGQTGSKPRCNRTQEAGRNATDGRYITGSLLICKLMWPSCFSGQIILTNVTSPTITSSIPIIYTPKRKYDQRRRHWIPTATA